MSKPFWKRSLALLGVEKTKRNGKTFCSACSTKTTPFGWVSRKKLVTTNTPRDGAGSRSSCSFRAGRKVTSLACPRSAVASTAVQIQMYYQHLSSWSRVTKSWETLRHQSKSRLTETRAGPFLTGFKNPLASGSEPWWTVVINRSMGGLRCRQSQFTTNSKLCSPPWDVTEPCSNLLSPFVPPEPLGYFLTEAANSNP